MNRSRLGDLLSDYQNDILQLDNAYNWLAGANAQVTATGSSVLYNKWTQLLADGEALRQSAAASAPGTSVLAWVNNLIPITSTLPGVSLIETTPEKWVAKANQWLSDVTSLKLGVDQYNNLTKAGVSQSVAVSTVEAGQMSTLDKITSALKVPAMGIGAIAAVALVFMFLPEIKRGIRSIRSIKE